MDDLMREVARRRQSEMRARAAEDHASARLRRKRAPASSAPMPGFLDRVARLGDVVRGRMTAFRHERMKM
jgi:hypothetical protein